MPKRFEGTVLRCDSEHVVEVLLEFGEFWLQACLCHIFLHGNSVVVTVRLRCFMGCVDTEIKGNPVELCFGGVD